MAVITAAATIGSAILGIGATTVTFATVAVGFAAQFAIGAALRALAPKPNLSGLSGSPGSRGYTVNQRGSALDHQIVYGRARVGGVVVFNGTTGTTNKFLHQVIAYTGHEIEAFDEIYINDAKVTSLTAGGDVAQVTLPDGTTSNRYSGFIRINKHLGATDQAADSDLVSEVSEWTSNHRLRNIAYLYIRYTFNADVFPNGVPQVTTTVKGKKVYDPRTDTTAWSDNPALCIRDYLTSDYGLAEDEANVDDALVQTAADVCDETSTGAGTTRYTCNGNFTAGQTPYDILGDLLTSMGGLLWYAQGEWRMKPAYWVAPTVLFTEDDLRSSVAVKTRHSRRDNFNTVRGTFRGDESDWQVTDYPEVTNAAFVAADNGQESVVDIDLPFTDNSIEARRLARITLERNRQQLTVSASFGLRAFQVQVGDVIELSVSRFGWNQKEFEVVAWTFGLTDGQDLQAQMTLREISESVFDEVDDGIVYERDNVTVLSPFEVPLPSLNTASAGSVVNTDGTTVPSITFSWSVTDASLVDYYDFQWKPSSASDWQSVVIKSETQFILAPAVSGVSYDYRVRAVSYLGVKSAYASSVTPVSTGDDGTTPNAPSNLVAEAGAESIKISWDAPTQNTDGSSILDLFQYRIYRNTTNNFGTSSLVGRISGDVFTDGSLTGGTTYYYWVTALDFTGNESAESAVASAEAALVETARSNGVFYIGVTTLPTTSSGADTDFTAAIGDPVDRDQAWFYTGTLANPTAQSVWIYDEATDTWTEQQEVIDGSLVVSGTITADRLEAQSLSALGLTIGTLSSSPSGERIVITDEKIEVYDSSNVLRVVLGNLA